MNPVGPQAFVGSRHGVRGPSSHTGWLGKPLCASFPGAVPRGGFRSTRKNGVRDLLRAGKRRAPSVGPRRRAGQGAFPDPRTLLVKRLHQRGRPCRSFEDRSTQAVRTGGLRTLRFWNGRDHPAGLNIKREVRKLTSSDLEERDRHGPRWRLSDLRPADQGDARGPPAEDAHVRGPGEGLRRVRPQPENLDPRRPRQTVQQVRFSLPSTSPFRCGAALEGLGEKVPARTSRPPPAAASDAAPLLPLPVRGSGSTPFLDGKRSARKRLFIVLYSRRRAELPAPLPSTCQLLATRKERVLKARLQYVPRARRDHRVACVSSGRWAVQAADAWISARSSSRHLRGKPTARSPGVGPKSAAPEVVDLLFASPILTVVVTGAARASGQPGATQTFLYWLASTDMSERSAGASGGPESLDSADGVLQTLDPAPAA